jgi:myo-inositol-1(or 4)-monophosphatase
MSTTRSALGADWLGLCRRAVKGLEQVLAAAPSISERAVETGTRGEGGDRTLVIDSSAEGVVLGELQALHDQGHAFTAFSEERGEVGFGGGSTGSEAPRLRVIIDPIDGSLNAKRGLPHHALSIAVADGGTMADVAFGFVYDFGPREEWWAKRGEGAWLNGERLDPSLEERRGRDGRLEVLGIESADPRWVKLYADQLETTAYRLRALGTIASSLCQVAAARFDGMLSLRRCRGVDAAAGQLIVREAGGRVSFPGADPMNELGAPLDAVPTAHVVAARSPETLHQLEEIIR